MDWSALISALVTGLRALAGVYIANRKSAALITYRLEQLEKKQTVHNNMIERVYKLEGRMNEAEHDICYMKGAK
jgi:hypothetical protein